MPYTLITPAGKVYTFYFLSVAEMYQVAYGGTLINPTVLEVTKEIA